MAKYHFYLQVLYCYIISLHYYCYWDPPLMDRMWHCLAREKYSSLHNHILFMSFLFGNKYICEQLFSRMKNSNNKISSKISWQTPWELIKNCNHLHWTRPMHYFHKNKVPLDPTDFMFFFCSLFLCFNKKYFKIK